MVECPVVFNVAGPSTVLATWEGVSVLRGQESVWIICDRDFEPECFDEAVRLLGLTGRSDYEVLYDPETGRETFVFDEQQQQDLQVRPVRDTRVGGVLRGLPER